MIFAPSPDGESNSGTVTVSLTLAAHSQAQHFRQHHHQTAKAKQVYLNTLAIYAVKTYLERAGFEVDLATGQSWNVAQQTLLNVADLNVEGHGVVECRPILPDQTVMQVPPEVWSGVSPKPHIQPAIQRKAYVAVGLEASLKSATLLGFIDQVDQLEVSLTELLPLDNLMPHLFNCAEPAIQVASVPPTEIIAQRLISLKQWLEGIPNGVETGWLQIEQWLFLPRASDPLLDLRYRSNSVSPEPIDEPTDGAMEEPTDRQPSVIRRKILPMLLSEPSSHAVEVALTVGLVEPLDQPSQTPEIWVQVTPAADTAVLPPHLVLKVLDNVGEVVMQAQSRSTEVMQLRFGVDKGELFSLQLTLDDVSITESFVL